MFFILNYRHWQTCKKARVTVKPVWSCYLNSVLSNFGTFLTQIDAPVPPADTPKLNSFMGPSKDHRSDQSKLEDFVASAERVARHWSQNAPTFRIEGVKLSALKERKRNSKADIQEADVKIEAMKGQSAYACSGRFLDEDNVLLAAVFAHNFRSTTSKTSSSYPPGGIPVCLVSNNVF